MLLMGLCGGVELGEGGGGGGRGGRRNKKQRY